MLRLSPFTSEHWHYGRKLLGKDHPDVAGSLNNLAGLYQDQGKYAVAEPLYKRSLALWERSPWQRPSRCGGTSLNNLGVLYHSQGEYVEAEPLYKRVTGNKWKKPSEKTIPMSRNL